MLETSLEFNLTDCWKQSIILTSLQMYEKKVECLLLPKAVAEKNVTSDENWIFSTSIGFNFCACDHVLAAKGKFECEECDSFTRVGSSAGTIGIFCFVF